MFAYALRHKMRVVMFVYASVGLSIFMSLPLLIVRNYFAVMLNVSGGDYSRLFLLGGLIFCCWMFIGYFEMRREIATQFLSRRSTTDLVNDVAASILRRPFAYFSGTRTGDLISRIMTDTAAADEAVGLGLHLLREPLTIALIVATTVYMNWRLALVAFVGFPLAVYPIAWLGRKIMKASRKARELTADLADTMVQLFSGAKVVKAFRMEDVAIAEFSTTTGNIFHQNMAQARAAALIRPVVQFVNGVGGVAVVVWGGYQVKAGHITVDELLTFIIALIATHKAAWTVSRAYDRMKYMTPGLERLFEMLDGEKAAHQLVASGTKTPQPLSRRISIRDVTFSYGRESVLGGVSADIDAGSVSAFVGPTGGGKTTILDLIAGFYSASGGVITWDDTPVSDYDRGRFLDQIAYAPQQAVLFNISIRENVRKGRPGASDADIEEVCLLAGVHDDIVRFQHGYDTRAGEAGASLSGGQKQRIALARALLKTGASVFLFDEPTSSLDVETELNLWQRVREYLSGKTIVLVAHRLSLVRNADRIYVVSGGTVEASGTHGRLIETSATYANLWRLHGER